MYKYEYLAQQIAEKIMSGGIKQSEKLPSIRLLSDQYGVSKSTVIQALDQLMRMDMIYSVAQSGHYVVPNYSKKKENVLEAYDFATSSPDPRLFPYKDFQHCINQAIQQYQSELFLYGTLKGLPSLIEVVKKLLMNDQVFTASENIVITTGVQQALSILLEMDLGTEGKSILIEQPTYHLFVDQLQRLGYKTLFIERTAHGLDMNALETHFRSGQVKFFYTMPRRQNPLGTTLSKHEMKEIVRLAQRYNVYVVEDDFLADYMEEGQFDPLYALDTRNRHVIYLKSFSKIIFPGLRIGIAVLPGQLVESFALRKVFNDIDTSMLSQAALEIYLKSGMFQQHKGQISGLYDRRSKILNTILEGLFYSVLKDKLFAVPKVEGIHTCIEMNQSIPLDRLKNKGVQLKSINENYFFHYKHKRNLLRLNVSNLPESMIVPGIKKIIDVLKN